MAQTGTAGRLTRELIATNKDISGYLPIGRQVDETIEGRACGVLRLPFLTLIGDIVRERFPERFCYLETGTLFGGSICAMSYTQRRAKFEKYAGIDIFTYYGDPVEPSSGVEVSLERADRNCRYFGPTRNFALFHGDSSDAKVAKRAMSYLRGVIHLLYIDGDHTKEGVVKDFAMYGPRVASGGVVVFDDYHVDEWMGVTHAVDGLDKSGWNDVGPLAGAGENEANVPTMYVLEKD